MKTLVSESNPLYGRADLVIDLKQMDYYESAQFYPDFEEWFVPHRFEKICLQYLIRQNRIGRINPVIEKIGKYYYDDPKNHTNGEFDVVTYDEKGYVFYEVKFRKHPLSESMIKEEVSQVEETGLNCYKYVFFSRSGFEGKETENIMFINLEELFYV